MKTKPLPEPKRLSLPEPPKERPLTPAQKRQQVEELKLRVKDLAERQMELSLRILRGWLDVTK